MIQPKFGKLILTIFIFFISGNSLFSEAHDYILKNADIVKYDVGKNDTITTLIGNVNLIYDGIEFFAENAQLFSNREMLLMNNNVRAIDDTLHARAEKVDYKHKNKLLHLEDDAVFIVKNSRGEKLKKISANYVNYFKDDGKLSAKGSVSALDHLENAELICGDFAYDLQEEYGSAKIEPILTFRRENNIKISSRQMEMFAKQNKFTATYDVTIKMKNSLAKGNFLIYFNQEEKAVLIGHPSFSSDISDATAQEFRIYFSGESIEKLHMISDVKMRFKEKGNEKSVSKQKSPKVDTLQTNATNRLDNIKPAPEEKKNYLWAQKVFVELENDKMSYLHALNVSKSLIKQKRKSDNDYFVNKLSTSDLKVFFNKNEKIQQVIAEGDISGIYKFLKK